jgi:hypothetical protein
VVQQQQQQQQCIQEHPHDLHNFIDKYKQRESSFTERVNPKVRATPAACSGS